MSFKGRQDRMVGFRKKYKLYHILDIHNGVLVDVWQSNMCMEGGDEIVERINMIRE